MRIAIYSRKSIETDKGESIKNQIIFCKQYFERQENCVFEIFEDEGFSGGNINRPAFQRMMELVKMNQFDAVAVYKIDRIARNIVDFVNIYDEMDVMNVKLVSVTEGFDPSTPVGKMMMLLLASFAEMERMNIAQRVKDNMKELAKMGRWSGGTPPTGYTTVKEMVNGKSVTYLKLGDEAENIKKIFEMYAEGYNAFQIEKYFKTKGLKYPSKTIYNIITNPTYLLSSIESINYLKSKGYQVYGEPNMCGFLPYNRRPRTKGKKLWDSKDKFVGISKHEAIIDLPLWIVVHDKINERTISPHPRESVNSYLAGLVKCKCGSFMYVDTGHAKKDGSRHHYFRCSSKKYNGSNSCDNYGLRIDEAENYVFEFLLNIKNNKNYLIQFIDKKDSKEVEKQILSINKKIIFNDKSMNNLADQLSEMSKEAGKVLIKKIEELTLQNQNLKEELLKLEREKMFQQLDSNNIDLLYCEIMKFINTEMTFEQKRNAAKIIFEKLTWDSNKNEIKAKLNL